MFSCEDIRIFSASTEKPNMSLVFFIKLAPVYYRTASLLKRWSTINFFLKIFFLRQLVFSTYYKKNLRYVSLQECCSLYAVALQPICVEESNYVKDYVEAKRDVKGKGQLLPFLPWVSYNIKHLLEKNLRIEQYT